LLLLTGKRVCVGYADGAVKLLDLKSGSSIFSIAAGKSGHDAEVTCVDCHVSDNVLITGSVDSTALLVNINTGKVMKSIDILITFVISVLRHFSSSATEVILAHTGAIQIRLLLLLLLLLLLFHYHHPSSSITWSC